MEANNLTPLQQKLLKILDWFHKTCLENDIKYYAIGGTMLGAYRHGGFIPWDDDIDVGMPREDYEKFISLFGDKQIGDYYIETQNSKNPEYLYCFTKIYDTTTTLTEKTRYKLKRGIFLDIFPLDGAGNSFEESRKIFASVSKKHKLLLTKSVALKKDKSLVRNASVIIGRLIPNFIINPKKLVWEINALCKKYNYNECEYVGNFFGNWGVREIMPKKFFGAPKIYKFNDIELLGVEDADSFLCEMYGDWKTLPPQNERISHHDHLEFDLNKPYK